MPRRSFDSHLGAMGRRAARAERERRFDEARQRAEQRKMVRAAEREAKLNDETSNVYLRSRLDEVYKLNNDLAKRNEAIEGLLAAALQSDPKFDLDLLRPQYVRKSFSENQWKTVKPQIHTFMPPKPTFLALLVPGAKSRFERKVQDAIEKYKIARNAYELSVSNRHSALSKFDAMEDKRKYEVEQANAAIDAFERRILSCDRPAVVEYINHLLKRNLKGGPDATAATAGYAPTSRHLVVDLELPDIAVIPDKTAFKYVKSNDEIKASARPNLERKQTYNNLIYQICLKCIDTIFRGTPSGVVERLTLNGILNMKDPVTCHESRIFVLSITTSFNEFQELRLSDMRPEQCLNLLKASISSSPSEFTAVNPIVELGTIDPNFAETTNVLANLDHRPNLLELTQPEFEALIINLFVSKGLDVYRTQTSHDGGVDCMAFDPHPLFGGKVAIFASRCINTVSISTIQEFFRIVQSRGASKGILITTSDYDKAASEFARDKRLELLDGPNLLHLLVEHTNTEAKIEFHITAQALSGPAPAEIA